jgi:hypothetical protein
MNEQTGKWLVIHQTSSSRWFRAAKIRNSHFVGVNIIQTGNFI